MIIGADNSAAVLICTDSGAKLLHYRAETFCFLQFSQASGNINISEIIDFDKKIFCRPTFVWSQTPCWEPIHTQHLWVNIALERKSQNHTLTRGCSERPRVFLHKAIFISRKHNPSDMLVTPPE